MPARLIEALATTEAMSEVFSDASVLEALLEFEVALARAEASLGVIPRRAAEAIAASAKPSAFDIAELARGILRAGTPGIPIAKMLIEVVAENDAAAASFVHWGATSQDVSDTALVLLLKKARPVLMKDLVRTEKALSRLSQQHKRTVMLGRTLLQAAPPITFGLKAAGWLSSVRDGREQLEAAFEGALMLQFGGATGTLAALGRNGVAVANALGRRLGLTVPEAPWHTRRERLGALVCACGLVTVTLGKMARDVSLLMQNEVAEASEPGGDGRGGSSTMPHKQNPIACSLALASATRVPGLVASFLSAMVQEHERGVGGWQAEWQIVASVVQSLAMVAESMAEVAEGLAIDEKKMRANIRNTQGAVFAERAAMALAPRVGRSAAQKILKGALLRSARQAKPLSRALAETDEVVKHLEPAWLRDLENPEAYLGSAEHFRTALISGSSRKSAKGTGPRGKIGSRKKER